MYSDSHCKAGRAQVLFSWTARVSQRFVLRQRRFVAIDLWYSAVLCFARHCLAFAVAKFGCRSAKSLNFDINPGFVTRFFAGFVVHDFLWNPLESVLQQ